MSLKDLLAQRAELEKQIAATQSAERSTALAQIRELMDTFGLSVSDLSAKPKKGIQVAAKYRNIQTGESWSGRGLQPKWLKAALASGKTLQDFSV